MSKLFYPFWKYFKDHTGQSIIRQKIVIANWHINESGQSNN